MLVTASMQKETLLDTTRMMSLVQLMIKKHGFSHRCGVAKIGLYMRIYCHVCRGYSSESNLSGIVVSWKIWG